MFVIAPLLQKILHYVFDSHSFPPCCDALQAVEEVHGQVLMQQALEGPEQGKRLEGHFEV